jgi:hypothetical protein
MINANDNRRGFRNDRQTNAGRKAMRGYAPVQGRPPSVPTIPPEWSARLLREGKTMTVIFDGINFIATVGDETLTQWVKSQQDAETLKALAERKRSVVSRLAGLGIQVPSMELVTSFESLEDYVCALPTEARRIIRMNADSFRAYMRAQNVALGATQTAVATVGRLSLARAGPSRSGKE